MVLEFDWERELFIKKVISVIIYYNESWIYIFVIYRCDVCFFLVGIFIIGINFRYWEIFIVILIVSYLKV